MSFAGPVTLLNPEVKEDFNTNLLKIFSVSHEKRDILQKLVFMDTFEKISEWVSVHSDGQKFIANPSAASDTDRLDCLFAIQEPIALALKPLDNRRKNGRDRRIIKANEAGDYAIIANILASAAATYWRNHGFFKNEKNIKLASFLKNNEKNIEKKELQKAQIEKVGAILGFVKSRKKGVFQQFLDFSETEIVSEYLEKNDGL